jgi:hypothetical protein
MKEKKIVGINTHFLFNTTKKFPSFCQKDFDKNISLYDYDTVLINSKISFQGRSAERISYQTGLCLSDETLFQLSTIFDSFRTQLTELLQQGKNIYVIMNQTETYYHLDYQHERYDFDIMSYLPIKVEYEILSGQEFHIENREPYNSFFTSIKQYISYENIIKCDFLEKLITIKGTDKCIGGVCNIYNGKIIFIPDFSRKSSEILIFENEKVKPETDNRDEVFLDAVFKLEERLVENIEEQLPDWAESFLILNEDDIKENISNTEQKLEKLQGELESQKNELKSIQEYKYLLTSSGKTLESIVKRVLQEIGFTLFETEENRTDVIAKYKDRDVVFEIKGVKYSAAEKNAAQLEKWVSEFISVNNKIPKAVLIVNGYYELPITERNEPIFPNQMLKFSKGREHCLLSTYQLLKLFIEIKQHPEKSEHLINELLNTVGVYENYK